MITARKVSARDTLRLWRYPARHAQHGQRLLLRRRGRIARVYHRLWDGRAYDPERIPEVARVLDEVSPRECD